MSKKVSRLAHAKLNIISKDGLRLSARYFRSKRPSHNCVILIHGYRGDGMHDHAHNVFHYHSIGCNVLLPDLRSHGDSEGKYIGFGTVEADDIRLWCRYAEEELGVKNILIHGVSMGASTAIVAAGSRIDALRGVVSDCAFTSGKDMFIHVGKNIMHLPTFPLADIVIMAARVLCRFDLQARTPIKTVKKVSVPLLFFHGTADNFVPTEMAGRLYDACTSEKSLCLISDAGHAECFAMSPLGYYKEISKFMKAVGM